MRRVIQILSVIALVALFLSSRGPAIAAGVSVSINAPVEVIADSDFTTTVDIADVADFDAGQLDVSFNTSVLRLDNVSAGLIGATEVPVSLWVEMSPGTYRIVVNVPGFPGVSGSGYLAVLHFHSIGSAGSSSDINFSNGFLNDNLAQEITATWTGDSVAVYNELIITTTSFPNGVVGNDYSTILEATGGNGSYTWSILSGSLPDGLDLSPAGQISGTPTTAGTFDVTVKVTDGQLSSSKDFTIKINEKPGDANGDGVINALDLTKVARIIVGLDSATYGSNANQDGETNSADITKIERIIAGLD